MDRLLWIHVGSQMGVCVLGHAARRKDMRSDYISTKNDFSIVAFAALVLAIMLVTILPVNAFGEQLPKACGMVVAHNTSVDGGEFLREGYASKALWQSDFEKAMSGLESGLDRANDLSDWLGDDAAFIDSIDISDYTMISDVLRDSDKVNDIVTSASDRMEEAKQSEEARRSAASQPSPQQQTASGYSGGSFAAQGVIYWNGIRYTYYSSRVLYHYRTPEWTAGADGVYRDSSGYVVVASNDYGQGSVVQTPFGSGKVYDCGCPSGTIDVYVNF